MAADGTSGAPPARSRAPRRSAVKTPPRRSRVAAVFGDAVRALDGMGEQDGAERRRLARHQDLVLLITGPRGEVASGGQAVEQANAVAVRALEVDDSFAPRLEAQPRQ